MCAPKPPFRIRPVLDIELTRSNSEKGQVQPLREPSERLPSSDNQTKSVGTPTQRQTTASTNCLPCEARVRLMA